MRGCGHAPIKLYDVNHKPLDFQVSQPGVLSSLASPPVLLRTVKIIVSS